MGAIGLISVPPNIIIMQWYGLSVGGTEWVIIIFVALVLILGTGKLPGAARKIGRAVNEYNRAKDGIEEHVKGMQDAADGIPRISGPVESEREKLEMIARSAGISPGGRSDEELRSAISKKIGQKEGGAARGDGSGGDGSGGDGSGGDGGGSSSSNGGDKGAPAKDRVAAAGSAPDDGRRAA